MIKIAELEIDNQITEYFLDNNKYFQKKDDEYIPTTKLYLASRVGCEWNKDCNKIVTEKEDNHFKAIYFIPIYDWISFYIFANGNSEEDAIENVKKIYNDFEQYNNKYVENEKRNKDRFMSKIHKFAFFNNKIHFFEDSLKDFRELVVELGIPDDARADEPIFGYVDDDKLVFFKHYFKENEREFFHNFIDCYKEKIIKHYNLKKCAIYTGVYWHEDVYKDENEYLLEELVDMDFDYYKPMHYLQSSFIIKEGICQECGEKVLSFFNSCEKCHKPVAIDCFNNAKNIICFAETLNHA